MYNWNNIENVIEMAIPKPWMCDLFNAEITGLSNQMNQQIEARKSIEAASIHIKAT